MSPLRLHVLGLDCKVEAALHFAAYFGDDTAASEAFADFCASPLLFFAFDAAGSLGCSWEHDAEAAV
jgi:hypothetical protein